MKALESSISPKKISECVGYKKVRDIVETSHAPVGDDCYLVSVSVIALVAQMIWVDHSSVGVFGNSGSYSIRA